ncbi:Serine/threonine-protein kinase ATR [Porphyridium purpureum]|uniref:Serine/threonine-protein kinase ATR n=1 Tax=Porphyridium purpureum TaxID=35688 RepID=A0A5J4YXU8_PORPP|nr:Serine/threonine-protein kinase ATR [Porphyridium purpureum]|eukprot:POR3171..scf209_3
MADDGGTRVRDVRAVCLQAIAALEQGDEDVRQEIFQLLRLTLTKVPRDAWRSVSQLADAANNELDKLMYVLVHEYLVTVAPTQTHSRDEYEDLIGLLCYYAASAELLQYLLQQLAELTVLIHRRADFAQQNGALTAHGSAEMQPRKRMANRSVKHNTPAKTRAEAPPSHAKSSSATQGAAVGDDRAAVFFQRLAPASIREKDRYCIDLSKPQLFELVSCLLNRVAAVPRIRSFVKLERHTEMDPLGELGNLPVRALQKLIPALSTMIGSNPRDRKVRIFCAKLRARVQNEFDGQLLEEWWQLGTAIAAVIPCAIGSLALPLLTPNKIELVRKWDKSKCTARAISCAWLAAAVHQVLQLNAWCEYHPSASHQYESSLCDMMGHLLQRLCGFELCRSPNCISATFLVCAPNSRSECSLCRELVRAARRIRNGPMWQSASLRSSLTALVLDPSREKEKEAFDQAAFDRVVQKRFVSSKIGSWTQRLVAVSNLALLYFSHESEINSLVTRTLCDLLDSLGLAKLNIGEHGTVAGIDATQIAMLFKLCFGLTKRGLYGSNSNESDACDAFAQIVEIYVSFLAGLVGRMGDKSDRTLASLLASLNELELAVFRCGVLDVWLQAGWRRTLLQGLLGLVSPQAVHKMVGRVSGGSAYSCCREDTLLLAIVSFVLRISRAAGRIDETKATESVDQDVSCMITDLAEALLDSSLSQNIPRVAGTETLSINLERWDALGFVLALSSLSDGLCLASGCLRSNAGKDTASNTGDTVSISLPRFLGCCRAFRDAVLVIQRMKRERYELAFNAQQPMDHELFEMVEELFAAACASLAKHMPASVREVHELGVIDFDVQHARNITNELVWWLLDRAFDGQCRAVSRLDDERCDLSMTRSTSAVHGALRGLLSVVAQAQPWNCLSSADCLKRASSAGIFGHVAAVLENCTASAFHSKAIALRLEDRIRDCSSQGLSLDGAGYLICSLLDLEGARSGVDGHLALKKSMLSTQLLRQLFRIYVSKSYADASSVRVANLEEVASSGPAYRAMTLALWTERANAAGTGPPETNAERIGRCLLDNVDVFLPEILPVLCRSAGSPHATSRPSPQGQLAHIALLFNMDEGGILMRIARHCIREVLVVGGSEALLALCRALESCYVDQRTCLTPFELLRDQFGLALCDCLVQRDFQRRLEELVGLIPSDVVLPVLGNASSRGVTSTLDMLQGILRHCGNDITNELCIQLGGNDEQRKRAEIGFENIALVVTSAGHKDRDGHYGTTEAVAEWLSDHFLPAMDVLGAKILSRKMAIAERVHGLRSLRHMLKLSGKRVHYFVPQVLATLSLSLRLARPKSAAGLMEIRGGSRSANDTVPAGILQARMHALLERARADAWKEFLVALGVEHVVNHLSSIVAILVPHLERDEKLAGTVAPVLRQTIEALVVSSSSMSQSARRAPGQNAKPSGSPMKAVNAALGALVFFPDWERASSAWMQANPDLVRVSELLRIWEKQNQSSEFATWVLSDPGIPTRYSEVLTRMFRICHVVGTQDNKVVKSLALEHMVQLMRENRDVVRRLPMYTEGEQRQRQRIASDPGTESDCTLFRIAFPVRDFGDFMKSLMMCCSDGSDTRLSGAALIVLGELGAIDPTLYLDGPDAATGRDPGAISGCSESDEQIDKLRDSGVCAARLADLQGLSLVRAITQPRQPQTNSLKDFAPDLSSALFRLGHNVLRYHLVPALTQQNGAASFSPGHAQGLTPEQKNVIGFSIQEVLAVCKCTSETPELARILREEHLQSTLIQEVHLEGPHAASALAASFWNTFSGSVRSVLTPFLGSLYEIRRVAPRSESESTATASSVTQLDLHLAESRSHVKKWVVIFLSWIIEALESQMKDKTSMLNSAHVGKATAAAASERTTTGGSSVAPAPARREIGMHQLFPGEAWVYQKNWIRLLLALRKYIRVADDGSLALEIFPLIVQEGFLFLPRGSWQLIQRELCAGLEANGATAAYVFAAYDSIGQALLKFEAAFGRLPRTQGGGAKVNSSPAAGSHFQPLKHWSIVDLNHFAVFWTNFHRQHRKKLHISFDVGEEVTTSTHEVEQILIASVRGSVHTQSSERGIMYLEYLLRVRSAGEERSESETASDLTNHELKESADELCSLLLDLSYELEDIDRMEGVLCVHSTSNIRSRLRKAEAARDYPNALFLHEQVLEMSGRGNGWAIFADHNSMITGSSPSRSKRVVTYEAQQASLDYAAYLECLGKSGRWSSVVRLVSRPPALRMVRGSQAEQAPQEHAAYMALLRAKGMEAAWRLGEWDELSALWNDGIISNTANLPSDDRVMMQNQGRSHLQTFADARGLFDPNRDSAGSSEYLSRMFLSALDSRYAHLSQSDRNQNSGLQSSIQELARLARLALVPNMAAVMCARSNHPIQVVQSQMDRVYPLLVQLHVIAEVEDGLSQFGTGHKVDGGSNSRFLISGDDASLVYDENRMQWMSLAGEHRQTVLYARRAVFLMRGEPYRAAIASLEIALFATREGNLTHAKNCISQGHHLLEVCSTSSVANDSAELNRVRIGLSLVDAQVSFREDDVARAIAILEHRVLKSSQKQGLRLVSHVQGDDKDLGARTKHENELHPNVVNHFAEAYAHYMLAKWKDVSQTSRASDIIGHFRQALVTSSGEDETLREEQHSAANSTTVASAGDKALQESAFFELGKYFDRLLRAAANSQIKDFVDNLPVGAKADEYGPQVGGPEDGTATDPSQYAPYVTRYFAAALRLGGGTRFASEAVSRMLTLAFDYEQPDEGLEVFVDDDGGSSGAPPGGAAARVTATKSLATRGHSIAGAKSVRNELESAIRSLPRSIWVPTIPQILSRVSRASGALRDVLVGLLVALLREHPYQTTWHIVPVCEYSDRVRASLAQSILEKAKQPVSQEHRAEFPRQSEHVFIKRLIVQMEVLVRHLIKVCKTQFEKERSLSLSTHFHAMAKMQMPLAVIVPTLQAMNSSGMQFSISSSHAWKNDESHSGNELGLLAALLGATGTLARKHGNDADSVQAQLVIERELDIDRPLAHNSAASSGGLVSISGFVDEISVFTSAARPKRLGLVGSDGNTYMFLCKVESRADIRKDARFMEYASTVNRLLGACEPAREREMQLTTYSVLPLNEKCGIFEWVKNLIKFQDAMRGLYQKCGVEFSVKRISEAETRYKHDRRAFFREWLLPNFPPLFHRFFLIKFGHDARLWITAQNRFTRSVALWSMAGYVVGLGDRHADNLLIDSRTGQCVHVDFEMLFEKGLTLPVPERVPFRLTQNMVDAMGSSGFHGGMKICSLIVIRRLREHRNAIVNVLETLLYDPFVDWSKSSAKAPRHGASSVLNGAGAAVTQVSASRALGSIESKLQGIVGGGLPLSAEAQVDRIIAEAVSEQNLARMYIWWMPFM